jgi:hypothetical protein
MIGLGAAATYLAVNRPASGLRPLSQPFLTRPRRPMLGIGVIRQTMETWRQASGYRAYSYVIVGLDLAREAARQPGRSLVYFSGTAVNRLWDAGVPYPKARRRHWLLIDRAGKLLTSRSYRQNYVADVGDPAYQHAWLANVSRLLRRNGDDGVFIDNALADLAPLAGTVLHPNRRCRTTSRGLLRPRQRLRLRARRSRQYDGCRHRRMVAQTSAVRQRADERVLPGDVERGRPASHNRQLVDAELDELAAARPDRSIVRPRLRRTDLRATRRRPPYELRKGVLSP